MTIRELSRRGVTKSEIARTLDVTEGTVRYHLHREAVGAGDGRSKQRFAADDWREAIDHWLGSRGSRDRLNLAALHQWLRDEHDYPGSLRSLQRFFKARYLTSHPAAATPPCRASACRPWR
jgi:transposase-like protein